MDDTESARDDEATDKRKIRRSRGSTRGFVFPVDEGGDVSTYLQKSGGYVTIRRRRRARRKRVRTALSGLELLIGFSVTWVLLMCFALILEVASDQEFFFIVRERAPVIEAGSYVIGNHAYLADGRVLDLSAPNADKNIATQSKSTSLVSRRDSVRWTRLFTVMVGGPLLMAIGVYVLGRIRRHRHEED